MVNVGHFFWLVAAWVKSRAERPSVSVVNRQLHVQIGCKLGIRNRKDELRVVNVGQNWRLDCDKSRHSEAELVHLATQRMPSVKTHLARCLQAGWETSS